LAQTEMTVSFSTTSGQTDMYGIIKTSALLELLQEAGAVHADALRLGREDLIREIGAIWVLARLYFRLEKPLRYGSRIDIWTAGRMPGKAMAYRDYDIYSDGQWAGEAVTASAVVDQSTRRLLRPAMIPGIESCAHHKTKKLELSRLQKPEKLTQAFAHIVRYSDLDYNGHVNNTKYADFICNAADLDKDGPGYVSGMRINYIRECLSGEELSLQTSPYAENGLYVLGGAADGDRFEAVLCREALR